MQNPHSRRPATPGGTPEQLRAPKTHATPRTVPTVDQSGMSRSEKRNIDRTTRVLEEAMTRAEHDHARARKDLQEAAMEALRASVVAIQGDAGHERVLQLMETARRRLDAADQIHRAQRGT